MPQHYFQLVLQAFPCEAIGCHELRIRDRHDFGFTRIQLHFKSNISSAFRVFVLPVAFDVLVDVYLA